MQITIDLEFKKLLRPLTTDERQQLETSIFQDGCRDPLVVWDGILVDGHNRHEICEEHGLDYNTFEIEFADRDAAMDWIDLNQIGKRNQTPDEIRVIMGRVYNRRKKAVGEHVGNQHLERGQNDPFPERTADKVAAEFNVSPATIKRAGADVAAVEKATPELQAAQRSGEVTLSTAAKAAKVLTPEKQLEVLKQAPGKAGKMIKEEVERFEAKEKQTKEWNEFVDKTHEKLRGKDFNPHKEKERVRVTHALYNALEAIAGLPSPEEVLDMIPDYGECRLDPIDDAMDWLEDFQSKHKEKKNERMEVSA